MAAAGADPWKTTAGLDGGEDRSLARKPTSQLSLPAGQPTDPHATMAA
jgi:hypothetical protein